MAPVQGKPKVRTGTFPARVAGHVLAASLLLASGNLREVACRTIEHHRTSCPGGNPGRARTPGPPIAWLLSQSHLIRPDDMTAILTEAAGALGLSEPRVYLADMQQRHLVPMSAGQRQPGRDQGDHDQATWAQASEPLAIETTTAGAAYRTVTVQPDQDELAASAGPA